MHRHHVIRAALFTTFAYVLFGFNASRAEPLITQGIGLQSCSKLASGLKPGEGLNHPPNYLLFYWVQGYLSAANIFMLNEYNNFVDMNGVDANTIVRLVASFCRANPDDKKPISAIDKFIRDADKVEVKE